MFNVLICRIYYNIVGIQRACDRWPTVVRIVRKSDDESPPHEAWASHASAESHRQAKEKSRVVQTTPDKCINRHDKTVSDLLLDMCHISGKFQYL